MYKKASKFRSLRGFLGGVFERAKSIKRPKVKRKHSPSKPSIKELQTKTKFKIILCPSCQQNFKSSEINNHFKKVHPKEKFTKCKFCDLIVFSENLVNHYKENHVNQLSLFRCEYCDQMIIEEEKSIHNIKKHVDLISVICEHCKMKYVPNMNHEMYCKVKSSLFQKTKR